LKKELKREIDTLAAFGDATDEMATASCATYRERVGKNTKLGSLSYFGYHAPRASIDHYAGLFGDFSILCVIDFL